MANAWMIKPLPIVAATASSVAAGTAGLNVANDYAGIVWRSASETAPFVVLDLGADQAVDTVMMFGLAQVINRDVQVLIATSAQGPSFGAGLFDNITPATLPPLLAGTEMPVSGRGVSLASVTSPKVGRYVRIIFAGPGAIEVARVAVGKRVALERNFSFGGAFGVRDLGSLDFSARGVLLRRRAKKLRTIGLTFSNVQKDEVEGLTKPLLEQIGNAEMIALVTDPSTDAQRQNRCYFGPLVGDLSHTQRNARGWEARINLVSVF